MPPIWTGMGPEKPWDQNNPWLGLLGPQGMGDAKVADADPSLPVAPMQAPQGFGDMRVAEAAGLNPFTNSDQQTINEANAVASASPTAGNRAPDLTAINKLMAKLNAQDTEGYKLQKDQIARMQALRSAMPTGPQGMDLSSIMGLVDAWNPKSGNILSRTYKAPETAMDRLSKVQGVDESILKAGQNLTKEQLDALKAQLPGEIAKVHYGMAGNDKLAEQDDKSKKQFIDYLNVEGKSGRFGGVAKSWNQIASTQKLETLMKQYIDDPNKLTSQESDELTIGLMNLLAPNNPGADLFNHLISPNVQRTQTGIKQWLLSAPQGANQGEFIKRAANTIAREKEANQAILNDFYKKADKQFGTLGWVKRDKANGTGDFKTILDAAIQSGVASSPSFRFNSQAPAGKITVSNGKETLHIDPSDLDDASKEGFQEVK